MEEWGFRITTGGGGGGVGSDLLDGVEATLVLGKISEVPFVAQNHVRSGVLEVFKMIEADTLASDALRVVDAEGLSSRF